MIVDPILQDPKLFMSGSPLHRENRENGKINSLLGKTQGFDNFAKTQGILFAQVVNSLLLKIQDITIFAVNVSKPVRLFAYENWHKFMGLA